MKKIVYLFLLVVVFNQCKSDKGKSTLNNLVKAKIDFDNLEWFSDSLLTDFNSLDTIFFETTRASVFDGFSCKIYVDTNYIFVFDNGRSGSGLLKVFNGNGKYLHTIGKIGNGPGEYVNNELGGVVLDKKNKELYVCKSRKMVKYSYNGNYIKTISYKKGYLGYYFSGLPSGDIIAHRLGKEEDELNFTRFNKNGEVMEGYCEYPERFMGSAHDIFSLTTNKFYFIPNWSDEILSIDSDNQLKSEFCFGIKSDFAINYVEAKEIHDVPLLLMTKKYLEFHNLLVNENGFFYVETIRDGKSLEIFGDLNQEKILYRDLHQSIWDNTKGSYGDQFYRWQPYFILNKDGSYESRPEHNGFLLFFKPKDIF